MLSSVFISYAREDAAFVRKLYQKLNLKDRKIWVDWDMPSAAEWLPEILDKIEEHDAFLFVITPDSVKSRVCLTELEHAAKYNKRIIPIIVPSAPFLLPLSGASQKTRVLLDPFQILVQCFANSLDSTVEVVFETAEYPINFAG